MAVIFEKNIFSVFYVSLLRISWDFLCLICLCVNGWYDMLFHLKVLVKMTMGLR